MLTCEKADALVMREVDGLLTDAERTELEAHAGVCHRCHVRREANLAVARALSLRVDARVPAGFAQRVSARVSRAASEGWLVAVDWRRWTEWMLPVAATLALVAALAAGNGAPSTGAAQTASADSTAQAIEAWAWSAAGEGTEGASALSGDMTDDELLETMLGTRGTESEGKGNGR
jgi:anti-sigma factor RsiW